MYSWAQMCGCESMIGVHDTLDAALKPVCKNLHAALNTRVCLCMYVYTYMYMYTHIQRSPHSKRAAQTKAYTLYIELPLFLSLCLSFPRNRFIPISSLCTSLVHLSITFFFFLFSFSPLLPLYLPSVSRKNPRSSCLSTRMKFTYFVLFFSFFFSFFMNVTCTWYNLIGIIFDSIIRFYGIDTHILTSILFFIGTKYTKILQCPIIIILIRR